MLQVFFRTTRHTVVTAKWIVNPQKRRRARTRPTAFLDLCADCFEERNAVDEAADPPSTSHESFKCDFEDEGNGSSRMGHA